MGFFDRIRHPVQGTATVTAATAAEGMRSPQEVRMTLAVQAIGFDPFSLERLAALHRRGALTDEELAQQKAKLLNG